MESTWYRTPDRPLGVAALAVATAIAGVATVLQAVWEPFRQLFESTVLGSGWLAPITLKGPPDGIIGGLLGAAFVVSGVGLWTLRPWAWWLALTVGGVGLVLSIGSILWMVVWAVVLVYLLAVHNAFRGLQRTSHPTLP